MIDLLLALLMAACILGIVCALTGWYADQDPGYFMAACILLVGLIMLVLGIA